MRVSNRPDRYGGRTRHVMIRGQSLDAHSIAAGQNVESIFRAHACD